MDYECNLCSDIFKNGRMNFVSLLPVMIEDNEFHSSYLLLLIFFELDVNTEMMELLRHKVVCVHTRMINFCHFEERNPSTSVSSLGE